ncbi:uncharacterized protein MEPE_02553 [Melanopsichium pennsylvanicum]|uniref:DUF2423 domain-containing protein n=2 Tax=Melanopsichium pennsylvanicum TaxID=63383 RepID=A0AAJ4XKJ0_9BASI|nr:conserved hypothetical protein [Melanopsichium pennsylvanicum 4]SNX83845.1 uncharacterized protein MEPE_02553 [Melanopsichium pennsylvanicum]
MAKSLRSSSKLKARNVKRHNPKSDYAVTEAARINALNARLVAGLKKDKLSVEGAEAGEGAEDEVTMKDVEQEDNMQGAEGEGEKVKISTSGPRNSRRETYRKSKGLTPFKNKGGNKLFDAHTSKNGGKPKRRR